MSENLDLARSIYADWERGDFSSAEWAYPEIDFVQADGPDPGTWTGLPEMAKRFRGWLSTWEGFRLMVDEYRELDDETVLVLDHFSGQGKASAVNLGQIQAMGAWVFHIRDGKVMRMIRYWDRDRALADLGLEE